MQSKILLLAGVVVLAPMAARAQAVKGPYVSLGAGVDFLQDEILDPSPALREPFQRSLVFDPGFAGQVSFGYGFGNGLRVEIEGDYLNNHVRKINEPFFPKRAGGYEQQYGGMVNALYDFNFCFPVHPYVGLGAGGQILEEDDVNFSVPGFVRRRNGISETAGAFAYQAIAGFSVPVPGVAGLALTAEYRFLGLLDPLPAFKYIAVSSATGQQIGAGNLKFGNVYNHSILLGLRYAFWHPRQLPPAPPMPVPVAAPAPAPARTYLVFFDWDRADLTDRARQIVAEAARASTHVQTTRIEVNGYTDTSGTKAYNQRLSVRRAESVASELVRDGVPRNEIAIQGYGETHLLVPTGNGVREPQNRRVEIILH